MNGQHLVDLKSLPGTGFKKTISFMSRNRNPRVLQNW